MGIIHRVRQRAQRKKALRQERAQQIQSQMKEEITRTQEKWKKYNLESGKTSLQFIPQERKVFHQRPSIKRNELDVDKTLKKMNKKRLFGRNAGGEFIRNIDEKLDYFGTLKQEAIKKNKPVLAGEIQKEMDLLTVHKNQGSTSVIIKTELSEKDARKLSSDRVYKKVQQSDIPIAVHEAAHGILFNFKYPAPTMTKEGMRTHEGLATYLQIKETEHISKKPFEQVLEKEKKRLPGKAYYEGAMMWNNVINEISARRKISKEDALGFVLGRMNRGRKVTIDQVHYEIIGSGFKPKRKFLGIFG